MSIEVAGVCGARANFMKIAPLMAKPRLVLTDSGGLQEEATILGIPCMALGENAEQPITIQQGTNRLVILSEDVHLFVSSVAENGLAQLMQVIKNIIIREVFKRFPSIRRFLCGGALWERAQAVRIGRRPYAHTHTKNNQACCEGSFYRFPRNAAFESSLA